MVYRLCLRDRAADQWQLLLMASIECVSLVTGATVAAAAILPPEIFFEFCGAAPGVGAAAILHLAALPCLFMSGLVSTRTPRGGLSGGELCFRLFGGGMGMMLTPSHPGIERWLTDPVAAAAQSGLLMSAGMIIGAIVGAAVWNCSRAARGAVEC